MSWRQSADSRRSWTSLSQPPAARSPLKYTINSNFVSFMRSEWPQKLLLMLWVNNGRVVQISAENNKQGFPMKQRVLTDGRVFLLLSKGYSCLDLGGVEKESSHLFGVALWMFLWVFTPWSLWKKREKDIPSLIDTTVPRHLEPKKKTSRTRQLFKSL